MKTALAIAFLALPLAAQNQIAVEPHGPRVIRDYEPPEVPEIHTGNSPRLSTTLRAGKMYLTLDDAIALAIENNLGLEVQRYGPLLADWGLKRAQAGGPVRGVPSASAQVSSVTSGAGVNGSIAAAGLGGGGGGGATGGNGNASIQQVGQVVPNLDPILQNSTTFSHLTQPQANTVVSQTPSLIQTIHTYNTQYQQGLLSGGILQFRDFEQYVKENAPSDALNPITVPHLDVFVRHNLLRGFGIRLNARSIRIAELDIQGSKETFRSQLVDLVSGIINMYWDLVSSKDLAEARRSAVEFSQKFHDDTKERIAAGALAPVELPRAAAELASRRQDLVIAETTVRQRENVLKDSLLRTEDPAIETAEIVPLDRMEVTAADDLHPVSEMVRTALENRPDVALAKLREKSSELSAIGTQNPLLPTLGVTGQLFYRGTSGTAQPSGGPSDPQFIGGYGTALSQIFHFNFPNESGSVYFSANLRNRQAQGDYGIDQLQIRQSQVRDKRDINQISVDVSNQVIALRQARARFEAAQGTRRLQQELLKAEQDKFSFGRSQITSIIISQRALIMAQTAEITALTNYKHARVSLDQVLGETLQSNHVSLDAALAGRNSSVLK